MPELHQPYIIPSVILSIFMIFMITSCNQEQDSESGFSGSDNEIRLMTLNPGHFHAALIQKDMLNRVDPTVHIFAPEGPDLQLHMNRIEGFNHRDENPTEWQTEIYTGTDYFERMLEERPGNVMVTAGNNSQKTNYIHRAVSNGIHVLSDKPMAINSDGWEKLSEAFELAEERGVLLYDIMTERHEVTSRIQRILSQNRNIFGELEEGTEENPAVIKESIHHLYKTVAGEPLRRPAWYFDVNQQGEGIVDVTTHLVDLSLWGTLPDEPIYHTQDIEMINASRWPTLINSNQFENITGQPNFPDYLQDQLEDDQLPYYSNGEINFTIRGHHVNVSVQWDYVAPEGGDDSHYSLMRGSLANIVIRQGADQNFKSTLYIEPVEGTDSSELEVALQNAVEELQDEFPGTTFDEAENGWQLDIPDRHYLGHEAHFGKVAEAYFDYLQKGELPDWEVPNMITKYFITSQARELAMDE